VEIYHNKIKDLILTPLKIIDVEGGDVLHAMKKSDSGYINFGEAYFSKIKSGVVKAWKRHNQMTLNLVACFGEVKFVVFDDRNINQLPIVQEIILSKDNYCRLTIPPKVWLGFQGIDDMNMILNIADIEHNSNEIDRKNESEIKYKWTK
jgi:dTDP-4-dehydrorhamnose 3,5-epimerase